MGPSATAATSPGLQTTPGRDQTGKETQAVSVTAPDTPSDDKFFDWPDSDDEALGQVADQAFRDQTAEQGTMLPPETPRKARKVDIFSTPSSHKRQYDEMATDGVRSYPTPLSATAHQVESEGEIFMTPYSMSKPTPRLLFDSNTPLLETPTPTRFQDAAPILTPFKSNVSGHRDPPSIASEILAALSSRNVTLSPPDADALRSICDRHELRLRGVTRGRDVLRQTLKDKENTITSLRGEIEALRSERETNRAVIAHLKRDMMTRREAGRGGRR